MTSPTLSIIVPSYNHCQYLCERLFSIYAQSCPDFELIILDDGSSDGSVDLIKELLKGKRYTFIVNTKNSGSPFSQWEKGLRLAKGKYVWIAESDDSCSPAFVSSILPYLENGTVALAYTRTSSIDKEGFKISDAFWPEQFNKFFFSETQIISSRRFLNVFLPARNCIPNVSSVIFSIEAVKWDAIKAAQLAARFKFVGDWIFWAYLLKAYKKEKILYLSSPLCLHRDHDSSTRVVLNRQAEGHRIRECSDAIHRILRLQGIYSPLTVLRALSFGWWNWLYEFYLSRYKPLTIELMAVYPLGGVHLFGFWIHGLRRLVKSC